MTKLGLPAIMKTSPTSETMFLSWSLRERVTDSIDMRRHKASLRHQGLTIDDVHYALCLTQLAQEGYGTLSRSRAGHLNRFQWGYRVDGIVKQALGDSSVQLIPIIHKTRRQRRKALQAPQPSPSPSKTLAIPRSLPITKPDLTTVYLLGLTGDLLTLRIHPDDKSTLITLLKELHHDKYSKQSDNSKQTNTHSQSRPGPVRNHSHTNKNHEVG